MDHTVVDTAPALFTPATLTCGIALANRLVKVATYEHGAAFLGGPPNEYHHALYTRWARGGWGMLITGNVQVCADHLTLGRDMVVPENLTGETILPFQLLASAMHGPQNLGASRPLAIMQLAHAGRQSSNVLGGRALFDAPLAPSKVSLGRSGADSLASRLIHSLLFQTPKEMTLQDIDAVVHSFLRGALLAHKAGFDGVELHASHGYLLAEFISPKTNKRTDEYSATPADNALRVLKRVVEGIRSAVPASFAIGVKVNAADYSHVEASASASSQNNDSADSALEHVRSIASWGKVDFLEISGGDYESPDFMGGAPTKSSPRQALFSRFSRLAMQAVAQPKETEEQSRPQPLILLTGGLRTPLQLSTVLREEQAHLLGVGRMAILCPDLPRTLAAPENSQQAQQPFAAEPVIALPPLLARWMPRIGLLGAGAEMAWYIVAMRRISRGEDASHNLRFGAVQSIARMWLWTAPSSTTDRSRAWTLGLFVAIFSLGLALVARILYGTPLDVYL